MKKGGGSESTIIIGPSKSVLVYTLHSLEYVLGLARFRVFVPNYIYIKVNNELVINEMYSLLGTQLLFEDVLVANPLNFKKSLEIFHFIRK